MAACRLSPAVNCSLLHSWLCPHLFYYLCRAARQLRTAQVCACYSSAGEVSCASMCGPARRAALLHAHPTGPSPLLGCVCPRHPFPPPPFLAPTAAAFSIIMLSAYTANLTANLTVSNLVTPLQTLADLKRSGRTFGVLADTSAEKYFMEGKV